ncbi:Na+/H+ antiporter subunit A [Nocardia grenadensis]|uniref:Na+/H+ antiporter subunit A n=1 Tax=Nocardia grenadensis TaxID=931537 RepID=UPI0007A42A3F|nr:Na+/H+ antiporter subunit A [Nocardia grenadensis]
MLAILLAHTLAALIAPSAVRVLGRNAFYPLALVPLGCLGWVIAHWNDEIEVRMQWAPTVDLSLDLRFDSLATVMSALVLGIGALVLAYCARYFTDDEPKLGSFAAWLVAFSGAMFGLVTSDNMLLLFTFWEITTVLSFLLVGHNSDSVPGRRAALQALLVTGAGGLAMLAGIIILGEAYGSYLLSDLLAATDRPGGVAVQIAVVLVLVGALSKSAIVPLHFWLPGAMAAPTPVSAYLHAAAMVKAGVYLIARLAPAFADAPVWRPLVLTLGLASMLLAGLRAMQVTDLKLVLAFGTVSQLGFLVTMVGLGTPDAALAGIGLVVAHALFKAALFLVVGIIDHGTGTRDLRELSGLGRRSPVLFGAASLAALSMAGIPPLWGFVAKESALAAALDAAPLSDNVRLLLAAGLVLGSMLTVAYSARFIWGAFADKPGVPVPRWHAPGIALSAAPVLLAVGSLGAGLAAPWMDGLLAPYAETLPGTLTGHLQLWHGLTLPLLLTVVIIAGGFALFAARDRFGESATLLGNADRGYDAALRAADRLSLRMTGAVQRGSLPLTQAVILGTLVIVPSVVLAVGTRAGVELRLWDSPLQMVIGAIMIAMALSATVLRNRLASVLVVGLTGYGCGVVFALHGAPDLALTQFLVETLTLVVFVLVLRAFPAEIGPEQQAGFQVGRAAIAIAAGIAVPVLAAFAATARNARPIWERIPDAAYEFGGGKNAVNVLLVDIRAWDTLGEISVLVVAATGVASLVFRSRRFGLPPRAADAPNYRPGGKVGWLPAGRLVDRRNRSMVLQITTRLVFPTIMVLSVYFFFSGHNAPGGGFAGGLIAGLALVLRYLAGGQYELGEALPVEAGHLLGAGLILAAGTASASLLLGAPPLSSAILEMTVPLLGHVKLVTSLFFDLGVYLIVVGLVLDVLRSLGARLDDELVQS